MNITQEPYQFPKEMPLFATARIAGFENGGHVYAITLGFSEDVAQSLIAHAKDESDDALRAFTGDAERFASLDSYANWYRKDRTAFALIEEKTEALAACIWFGEKEPPVAVPQQEGRTYHTASFRSYPPYRGKGLMKPFARFVLDTYQKQFGDVCIWLSTSEDNTVALGLYHALGFKEYARKDGKMLMVLQDK